MPKKPNIVLLFTDDQRFDTIHALGNKAIITPNMDKLVAAGTTFTQGHIPSGTSGAVCMPSRAMLHSGRTLFHLQGAGESIPAEHITLGETLQKAGYYCFGTGKWHNGPAAYARSFNDGGEIMFGGMADHWNVPMCHYAPDGNYPEPTLAINDPMGSNKTGRRVVDHINFGQHSTDTLADFTTDFITNYQENQPFFVYTAFLAPHDPRSMPDRFRKMYDPAKIEIPENFAGEHPFVFGVDRIRDEVLAPYPRTIEDTKQQIAEYYAMITHLDDGIGRIIDAVKARGEYDNTIFVMAGDNGLAVGQHGLFGKQNHYEHSIRVPLIFAGPGIPADERREQYAYLLDIYPTLCDLLNIEPPSSVEGISLKTIITSNGAPVRESLFFAYTDLIRSCKDDRYKLIIYSFEKTNRIQLFDLREDPKELKNLAADARFDSEICKLYDSLAEFRNQWDDRSPAWGQPFWKRFEENGGLVKAVRV